MLWGYLLVAVTWRLGRIKGRTKAAPREFLEENLLEHAQNFRQDSTGKDLKHTVKTMLEWLLDKFLHVLEWPRLEPH